MIKNAQEAKEIQKRCEGKTYLSEKQWLLDAGEADGYLACLDGPEVQELVEALEHCKNRPHEHNPSTEFTITKCEVIDRALAAFKASRGGKI